MRLTTATALLALLTPLAQAQYSQQGSPLVSDGSGGLGTSVAVSADGNTAVFGGPSDNGLKGAIWVFVRNNGAWTQQGAKLVGTPSGNVSAGQQGKSVAISADGNTIIEGAVGNNGGAFIFARSNGAWTQQGSELIGTKSSLSGQGSSVALSADGNIAFVGAAEDNFATGAFWIYMRSGSTWTQVGDKLTGTGATGSARQGGSIACSSDGSTVVVAGSTDTGYTGAAWVFVRSGNSWLQQGLKLIGAGATTTTFQSTSVAISSDGNTILLGRDLDNSAMGAAWVFTRTNGAWTQQGNKLVGTGAVGNAHQGASVALSGDGNTAVLGASQDNTLRGAAWVFQRSSGVWNQLGNKLAGANGAGGFAGSAVAISADAGTVIVGAPGYGGTPGGAFVFLGPSSVTPSPGVATPPNGSGYNQTFTFNFYDSGGWQKFTILDILINSAIDGRQGCYIAFQPSSNSVFLVDDAGDAGGPYAGMTLPGNQSVSNNQCTISGTGSSVTDAGSSLTLTLAITFTPSFAGNKIFYLAAQDSGANSGWQAQGTWYVPGSSPTGPSVTGMTNAYSVGLAQNYTFTFTDSKGWQDLTVANILINSAINGVGACYIAFLPAGATTGAVDLVDNAGDAAGPYAGLTLPSSNTVSNGQCTINGTGSSVSASGNTLQLTLAVTFTPAFGGNRIVYAAAGSATQNSGWQAVGTVLVQ